MTDRDTQQQCTQISIYTDKLDGTQKSPFFLHFVRRNKLLIE